MVLISEAPVTEVPGRVRPRRSVAAWVAVGLVCAWVVPVLTHVLRVDWVLPPLVVLAVAALLRSGRTLLDRLVLAFALLLGATCAAGLLIRVWPWGLHPVPVAGVAFTRLGGIAVALRRGARGPPAAPAGASVGGGLGG